MIMSAHDYIGAVDYCIFILNVYDIMVVVVLGKNLLCYIA